MARIRAIKPEFFLDEDVAAMPPLTRILFQGLWCLADAEGRLEDRPMRIKIQILPYDKYDIDQGLNDLHNAGFIIRYTVDSHKLIQIRTFSKHQRISGKEAQTPSIYPGPEQGNIGEAIEKQPGSNGDQQESQERKGKERKGKGIVNPKKQKTTLPPDFSISESVRKWAAEKGFKRLDEHLEAFKAKCMAKGYEYIDWDSAFREAIRTDWAKLNTGGGNGRHGEGGHGIQPTGRAMPKEYRGEDIPIPDEQTRKDNVERARALTRSLAAHNIPSGNT